jgi:hypothetical protein
MRLTPNAVCQQDDTEVTLVGTDSSEEYKTKTFKVLVNDGTSGSCVTPEVGVFRMIFIVIRLIEEAAWECSDNYLYNCNR